MTEEELEKFTVDFMNNETGTNWSRIDSIMGKMLIKYAEVFQKRIEELEKENAELKGEADSVLDNWCRGNDPCPHLKKRDEQLTKAKELLKEFVHHYKDKTIYIENMQDLLEQVERFIKDSEVEK